MKRSLSFEAWIRAWGVAVIVGVIAMTRGSAMLTASAADRLALADEGPMPDLGGAPLTRPIQTFNDRERPMPAHITWLNSAPVRTESLRGKVVLVDFWTYSCINSLRNLPYIKAWAAKYKDAGLVVIGVHTPEFSFEKVHANVERATHDYSVTYPVPIDSDYRIWQAFNNEYWPADYFIDGKGRIRYHHFGEGQYGESERVIQELLKDNGATGVSASTVRISSQGAEAPPSDEIGSPETYVGYRRAERFASPERLELNSRKTYSPPANPAFNQWGFGGSWNVGPESAVLQSAPGKIVFRFHARDVNVVMGPANDGKPVRFRVKLDGTAANNYFGVDSAPNGTGEVRWPRMYQLIREKGPIQDRTFEIEFLDPGVHAYVFTFG